MTDEATEQGDPIITEDERARYSTMPITQLEGVVREKIAEHRRLMESEQSVYDEWESAKATGTASHDVLNMLAEECLRRRRATLDQQEILAFLIDLLGFLPNSEALPEQADAPTR